MVKNSARTGGPEARSRRTRARMHRGEHPGKPDDRLASGKGDIDPIPFSRRKELEKLPPDEPEPGSDEVRGERLRHRVLIPGDRVVIPPCVLAPVLALHELSLQFEETGVGFQV